MNKFHIVVFSSLCLANSLAAAQPMMQGNSFFQAVLEYQASKHAHDEVKVDTTHPYTHKNEQANSLIRAVLAKQGVHENILITAKSQISASQYDPDEGTNSLLRGALSRHYKATH